MRRRSSFVRYESYRDARLIVIATEGKDTERIYFNALAEEYSNPRVHVEILERDENEKNNSSPHHVLQQMNEYKSQYALEADDELWLVIDKDRWKDAMLSDVAMACKNNEFMHLALSNPCIELWLLLHLIDVDSLPDEEKKKWEENRKSTRRSETYLKALLRKELGSYHESNYNTDLLIPHVEVAIERAESIDENIKDRWPQTLGTRVYMLAKSVIDKRN